MLTVDTKQLKNYLNVIGAVKNDLKTNNLMVEQTDSKLIGMRSYFNDLNDTVFASAWVFKDEEVDDEVRKEKFEFSMDSDVASKYGIEIQGETTKLLFPISDRVSFGSEGLGVDFKISNDIREVDVKHDFDFFYTIKATDLIKALEQTVKSIGNDKTMANIKNLSFKHDFVNNTLELASIDGFRCSIKKLTDINYNITNLKMDVETNQSLVNRTSIQNLLKVLKKIKTTLKKDFNDYVMINVNTDYIQFQSNGIFFVSKLYEGTNFFDYDSIIPNEENINVTFKINRDKLLNILKKLNTVKQNSGYSLTCIEFCPKHINIIAENDKVDLFDCFKHENLKDFYETEQISRIGFNTKYMIDALEKLDRKQEIELQFYKEYQPIVVKFQENENNMGKNIILPIRLK